MSVPRVAGSDDPLLGGRPWRHTRRRAPGPLDVHFGILTAIREIQEAPTLVDRSGERPEPIGGIVDLRRIRAGDAFGPPQERFGVQATRAGRAVKK